MSNSIRQNWWLVYYSSYGLVGVDYAESFRVSGFGQDVSDADGRLVSHGVSGVDNGSDGVVFFVCFDKSVRVGVFFGYESIFNHLI